MKPRVISYSGARNAQEPREFFLGEEHHLVDRVESTWLEQSEEPAGLTRQIWLVANGKGKRFRLTYHMESDFWEVEEE